MKHGSFYPAGKKYGKTRVTVFGDSYKTRISWKRQNRRIFWPKWNFSGNAVLRETKINWFDEFSSFLIKSVNGKIFHFWLFWHFFRMIWEDNPRRMHCHNYFCLSPFGNCTKFRFLYEICSEITNYVVNDVKDVL